jgi:hypothetical protein
MKYIKPHRYKKSSLQSETTKNEEWHQIPRKYFVLWALQILRSRRYNSAQRHMAITMISLKAVNFYSALFNAIICSLVGRNCIMI